MKHPFWVLYPEEGCRAPLFQGGLTLTPAPMEKHAGGPPFRFQGIGPPPTCLWWPRGVSGTAAERSSPFLRLSGALSFSTQEREAGPAGTFRTIKARLFRTLMLPLPDKQFSCCHNYPSFSKHHERQKHVPQSAEG